MQEIPNCHFLIRMWIDDGKVCCEEDFIHLFEPALILDLKENRRPIEDWFLESFREVLLDDPESYIPENVEICGEPIFVEVIGTVNVIPHWDYYGEYDEDVELEIHFWSVALDYREEEANIIPAVEDKCKK